MSNYKMLKDMVKSVNNWVKHLQNTFTKQQLYNYIFSKYNCPCEANNLECEYCKRSINKDYACKSSGDFFNDTIYYNYNLKLPFIKLLKALLIKVIQNE